MSAAWCVSLRACVCASDVSERVLSTAGWPERSLPVSSPLSCCTWYSNITFMLLCGQSSACRTPTAASWTHSSRRILLQLWLGVQHINSSNNNMLSRHMLAGHLWWLSGPAALRGLPILCRHRVWSAGALREALAHLLRPNGHLPAGLRGRGVCARRGEGHGGALQVCSDGSVLLVCPKARGLGLDGGGGGVYNRLCCCLCLEAASHTAKQRVCVAQQVA